MTIVAILISAGALVAFVVAGWLALLVLEVTLGILRQGPRAVDEAFKRGDSIGAWFDPAKAPLRTGPHHEFRKARAGRKHKKLGVVAVTERASTHFYGR